MIIKAIEFGGCCPTCSQGNDTKPRGGVEVVLSKDPYDMGEHICLRCAARLADRLQQAVNEVRRRQKARRGVSLGDVGQARGSVEVPTIGLFVDEGGPWHRAPNPRREDDGKTTRKVVVLLVHGGWCVTNDLPFVERWLRRGEIQPIGRWWGRPFYREKVDGCQSARCPCGW
jgi:hypothetical protein